MAWGPWLLSCDPLGQECHKIFLKEKVGTLYVGLRTLSCASSWETTRLCFSTHVLTSTRTTGVNQDSHQLGCVEILPLPPSLPWFQTSQIKTQHIILALFSRDHIMTSCSLIHTLCTSFSSAPLTTVDWSRDGELAQIDQFSSCYNLTFQPQDMLVCATPDWEATGEEHWMVCSRSDLTAGSAVCSTKNKLWTT